MQGRARTLVLSLLLLQLHSERTGDCALRKLCRTQETPSIERPRFELPNPDMDACSITRQIMCKVRRYRRLAGLRWQALQYRLHRITAGVWDSMVDMPQRLRAKMAGLATLLVSAWDGMLMLWSTTSDRVVGAYRTALSAMARATPAVLGRTWHLLIRVTHLCTTGPLIWVFGQTRAFLGAVPQAVAVVVAEVRDIGQILLDTLEQSLQDALGWHLWFAYRYAIVSLVLHIVGAVAALTWLACKVSRQLWRVYFDGLTAIELACTAVLYQLLAFAGA